MFNIKMSFKKLKFDLEKFSSDLSDAIANEVKEGTRAFLRAVISKTPVYTGQARSTLKPLGRFLGVNVKISPTRNARRKEPNAEDTESLGSFSFEQSGLMASITVTERLTHYLINEFYDVRDSGFALKAPVPWQSFEAGRLAYIKYMRDHLKHRIPIVTNYVTYTLIKES